TDYTVQVGDQLATAEDSLETGRLAGQLTDMRDLVEQLVDVADVGVTVRALRILTHGNAADRGDFRRDLGTRQQAPHAGLGALAELDADHLYLLVRADRFQLVVVELPVRRAHAVLGRADLEHDVATTLEVIRRKATLAGIHPDAGLRRTM